MRPIVLWLGWLWGVVGCGPASLEAAQPPTGTDRTVSLLEDSSVILSPGDFGFADAGDDPPNQFTGVRIASLPGVGALKADGRPVALGQFIEATPLPGIQWATRAQEMSWRVYAVSADGMNLAAAGFQNEGGRIFISTDGGLTWAARTGFGSWEDAACSADGTRWIASDYLGRLHVSVNSGSNWNPHGDSGSWGEVASSADGRRLYALNWHFGLYRSLDSGATWSWAGSQPTAGGGRLVISPDGSRVMMVNAEARLVVSQDFGDTWQTRGQIPGGAQDLAVSDDGLRLAAVRYDVVGGVPIGYRSLSADGGQTWTSEESTTKWYSITMSTDGRVLAAASESPEIHVSRDFGATWTPRPIATGAYTVRVSADGRKLAAGGETKLLVSDPTVPVLEYSPGPNDHGVNYATVDFKVEDDGPAASNVAERSNTLTFRVDPVNDPPVAARSLDDRFASVGSAFAWTVPEDAFTDVDDGTVLAWTATRADGSALPTWLTFDPATATFSGVPPETERGTWRLRVIATDNGTPPSSAFLDFTLHVGSDAPAGTDGLFTTDEDVPLIVTPAHYGFTDPGDVPADRFTRIVLSTLPGAGNLTVEGVELAAGDLVPVVPEARLRWTRSGDYMNFTSLAVSADGSRIGAAADSSLVFSTDSGQTWTRRETGKQWVSVSCSADGQRWIGGVFGGQLHLSTDAGITWQPRETERNWNAVAISADGSTLMAGTFDGRLYVSTDAGQTWSPRGIVGKWVSVTGSSDGTRWLAADQDGRLHRSVDSGHTWTATGETRTWYGVSSSADGTTQAAMDDTAVFLSTDSGQTWREVHQPGGHGNVTVSADGRKLAAVVYNGVIHVSRDSGRTWIAREQPRAWRCVAGSADGDVLFAAGQQVQVHRSQAVVPEMVFKPTLNASGQPYASFTFQVEDDGASGPTRDPSPNILTVNVRPVNDAPVLKQPLSNAAALERSAFRRGIGTFVFEDVDSDTALTLSAAQASGLPLPGWLSFDPATQTFSGTPGFADTGLLVIEVTATDNGVPPLSVSDQFEILVGAVADPPVGRDGFALLRPGGSHVFQASDFALDDPLDWPPNVLSKVRLTTLPAAGSLTVDGQPATVGQAVRLSPSAAGEEWQARGSSQGSWVAVACSADGTRLLAATESGRLYVSQDAGITWAPRESNRTWRAVTVSADGMRMAAASSGRIYVSSDAGATWTARGESLSWRGLASSSDGMRLVAGSQGGWLQTSSDFGLTWTPRETRRNWRSVASSDDGMRLAAVDSPGRIYVSTDGGVTWMATGPTADWRALAGSADGQRWFAAARDNRLYISADGGVQWSAREPSRRWTGLASSADGSHVVATAENSQIFVSRDFGSNWQARDEARAWTAVASSGNGTRLLASVANAKILHSDVVAPSEMVFTPQAGGIGTPYTTFSFQVEDDGVLPGDRLDPAPNVFRIDVGEPNPFQAWAMSHGLSPDPAGSGAGDALLRYQFGMDPRAPEHPLRVQGTSVVARGMPVLTGAAGEPGAFAFLYSGRTASGLTTRVEFSADLTDWQVSDQPHPVVAEDDVVEIRRATFPTTLPSGARPHFARLVVIHP